MSIDTEGNPKTTAPEERNVVRDDSHELRADSWGAANASMELAAYKYFSLPDWSLG